MVLMGTNYVYNQQQAQYYNNSAYNPNANYNRTSYNGSVNKNYFQGIEKTASRVYFSYNYQASQNASSPQTSYFQAGQQNMYQQQQQSQTSQQSTKKPQSPPSEISSVKLSKSKTLSKNFKVSTFIY